MMSFSEWKRVRGNGSRVTRRFLGALLLVVGAALFSSVGSSAAMAPTPTPADPKAPANAAPTKGTLDKELIRSVIRRHIDEVRLCYERELTKQLNLTGRVEVQFTIGLQGAVLSSIVHSSTLGNPTAEQCIAAAVRRWLFPKPQGGIVIVTYPFVLKPAEDAPPRPGISVAMEDPPADLKPPADEAPTRGTLDKEAIRATIRSHIEDVRLCCERALTSQPNLAGRIMVQFTIGLEGAVLSSIVHSSTLGNPTAEQCISTAVRRWLFPKPQGGIVIVTYPFVLKAAEGDAPLPPDDGSRHPAIPSSPMPPTPGPSLVPAFFIMEERLSGEEPRPDPSLLKKYFGNWPRLVYLVCIHPSGYINSVSVEHGRPELDPPILATLKTWRFKPQPKQICFEKVVTY